MPDHDPRPPLLCPTSGSWRARLETLGGRGPQGGMGPGRTQDPQDRLRTMHAAEGAPSLPPGCLLWAPSWVPETRTAGGTAGVLLRSPTPWGAGTQVSRGPFWVCLLFSSGCGWGQRRQSPYSVWTPPPLLSDTHRALCRDLSGGPRCSGLSLGRKAVRGQFLEALVHTGTSPGRSDPSPQAGPLQDHGPSPRALRVTQGH